MILKKLYEKHPAMLAMTYAAVILFSLGALFWHLAATGTMLPLDVELTGGKEVSISLAANPDINAIKSTLSSDVKIRIVPGISPTLVLQMHQSEDEKKIIDSLKNIGISGEISLRAFGPSLGAVFWSQAQIAMVLAFIAMAILIFIIFRTPVPSSAIVMAALSDMLFVLAMLAVFDINVSLATIAGVLMIIGYSVDTDIILTTTVMRETEMRVADRTFEAFKTGITITITALIAVFAMYFASGSGVIQDIATVLIIGLFIDIPITWLGNAGILSAWMKKRTGM